MNVKSTWKRLRLRGTKGFWIWIILNYLFIILITREFGLIAYPLCLLFAVSTKGEKILRYLSGCKRIKRVEILQKAEPLFQDAYKKAKKVDPSIPDDVELFMCADEMPNAYALGRRTICITSGLLRMDDDMIKGCIGHEFGHLSHYDTDLILIITIGNLLITGLATIGRIIISLYGASDNSVHLPGYAAILNSNNTAHEDSMVMMLILNVFMWGWTKLGTKLVLKSNHGAEYEADEFAFNLGYGNYLCSFLDATANLPIKGKCLFAALESSHPDPDDRIHRMQSMGAVYRKIEED